MKRLTAIMVIPVAVIVLGALAFVTLTRKSGIDIGDMPYYERGTALEKARAEAEDPAESVLPRNVLVIDPGAAGAILELDTAGADPETAETGTLVWPADGQSDEIPDGYFAVLRGGCGEITYDTYVYGDRQTGFEYINVMRMTVSWGSTRGVERIAGRGTADDIEDVIAAAESICPADCVTYPGDSSPYSVDDLVEWVLMK